MSSRVTAAVLVTVLLGCGTSRPGGQGGGGQVAIIAANGGTGASAAGGDGGRLAVNAHGGEVVVSPTGTLPAPWRWSYVAPALGANPRTVTGTTTLKAAAGAILGDDGASPATGLRVAAGAVATLEPDANTDADGLPDQAVLSFSDGVLVEGTLQLGRANGGASAASWAGAVGALAIRPGGKLVATGTAGSAATDGGAGGAILVKVAGSCTVEGTVDTRGARGKIGGPGGQIDLVVSSGAVVVSGVTDSSGGEGLAGVGGDAGPNSVWGRWAALGRGDFLLTGSMLARGGSGTAGGGLGGDIYGSGCHDGQSHAAGVLDGSGGDATVDGPGGTAPGPVVEACNGRLVVGGSVLARGGRGAGAGEGGWGGVVTLGTTADVPPPGLDLSTTIGATVDVRGGSGAAGGKAGRITIHDDSNTLGVAGVTLYTTGVDVSGGAGVTAGGLGGTVTLQDAGGFDGTGAIVRLGGLSVGSPISSRGGAATGGPGGGGGEVSVSGYRGSVAEMGAPSATRQVSVTAPLDTSGGAGSTLGGGAGRISLFEHVGLVITAPLLASGGAGGTGPGGDGSLVILECDGTARVAAVTADGGGSANAAGGVGGEIQVSSGVAPSAHRGVLSVRGGAGATPGATGMVVLDGTAVTLSGGQLAP